MKTRRGDRQSAHPSRTYTAAGAALGFGAPLGFLLLRLIASGRHTALVRWAAHEIASHRAGYAYMTVTTPFVFAMFGGVLGHNEQKRASVARHLQQLRDEFAAVVAHELRNPLQAIVLEVEALLRHAGKEEAVVPVRALRRLRDGGARLSQMVDDLLDASRIEASRLSLDPRTVDVVAAVEALIDRIRSTLGTHRTEIVVESTPLHVLADPARLDQILTNLIENAAKYSAEGTPIRIHIRPCGAGTSLTVEDCGPGIAKDDLPKLFDRFYQTKRARRKKTGLGLGLYITKGLVDAQGGRIDVHSELGKGSRFSVWLPEAPGERRRARQSGTCEGSFERQRAEADVGDGDDDQRQYQ